MHRFNSYHLTFNHHDLERLWFDRNIQRLADVKWVLLPPFRMDAVRASLWVEGMGGVATEPIAQEESFSFASNIFDFLLFQRNC